MVRENAVIHPYDLEVNYWELVTGGKLWEFEFGNFALGAQNCAVPQKDKTCCNVTNHFPNF